MRTEEKRSDTTAQSGSSTSGAERTSTTQQSAGGTEVARPLPSAAEPGTARPSRGGVAPFRTTFPASPWELMRNMSEEIDRLIDNLAGIRTTQFGLTTPHGTRGPFDFGALTPSTWTPQVEVIQRPNALVLRADLPGLKPDDVNLSVDDGMLTISGERKQEHKEEREGFLRTERSYGHFYRTFPLPTGVDEEKINASFKDGVLEISVPHTGRESGRKIKIQS